MVKNRSELSRSRTSIHGGIRRGAAAAAVGAVLVLSAGVPASLADDGSTPPARPEQAATPGNGPGTGGVLKDLLGRSGASGAAPTTSASASPSAITLSPVPLSTAAPSTTVTPSPVPRQTSTGDASAAPGTATPTPDGQNPVPAVVPTAGVPDPATGTHGGPSPATPGQSAEAETEPQDSPEPDTQDSTQPDSAQQGSAAQSATQPGPEQQGTAPTVSPAGSASPSGTPSAGYTAVPTGGPGTAGSTPSRQAAAATREAEPVAEAAKVWLGVGLLGSAGAAGLVFFRIRRI